MIREQIYRAERQRLERPRPHNRNASDKLPSYYYHKRPSNTDHAGSRVARDKIYNPAPPPLEHTATPSIYPPELHIPGLLDLAVKEYSTWQQSRLSDETLKAEVGKACEVALDDGLDLTQIEEDKNPDYFTQRGIKWGIARRFVKDIRLLAENVMVA
ncbi:hypothetical protein PENFLA_c007G00907 [Penicillium flavigenum]|uniref:Uncharacterized protein n=1 Tax=Penicillium flavigenum TaxID=254877 RepID=A0A1V6TIE1_9EURO|nr:hypothetical protein PENFLA_c007G00907 [Penicillium flavigenum]